MQIQEMLPCDIVGPDEKYTPALVTVLSQSESPDVEKAMGYFSDQVLPKFKPFMNVTMADCGRGAIIVGRANGGLRAGRNCPKSDPRAFMGWSNGGRGSELWWMVGRGAGGWRPGADGRRRGANKPDGRHGKILLRKLHLNFPMSLALRF